MTLSLPAKWDIDLLEKYLEIVKEPFEVYDSLRDIFSSGRCKEDLPEISLEKARSYREHCKKRGVHFNYLINAPFANGLGNLEELDKKLNLVLSLEPDSITLSNLGLMMYIHKKSPNLRFNISTIAGVSTPNQLEKFLGLPIRKMVAPQDLNRDLNALKILVDFAGKKDISVELIANETCPSPCSIRKEHYKSIEEGYGYGTQCKIQTGCNTKKLEYPLFILHSVWIRPEDLYCYEKIGITHFKLTCRTKPSDWFPETVRAYFERTYEGNLMRICGITPPGLEIEPHDLIFLDNKSLDGFLEELFKSKDRKALCEKWIAKLFLGGKFKINPVYAGKYVLEDGKLKMIEKGKYFLEQNEKNS